MILSVETHSRLPDEDFFFYFTYFSMLVHKCVHKQVCLQLTMFEINQPKAYKAFTLWV